MNTYMSTRRFVSLILLAAVVATGGLFLLAKHAYKIAPSASCPTCGGTGRVYEQSGR